MKRLFIVFFFLISFIAAPAYAAEKLDEQKLDEIAKREAHDIPLDLKKTTHGFSKTDNGGIQKVIVKDKSEKERISLIRIYLTRMANDHQQGNFSDLEKRYGADMPGLSELKAAKPGQIRIESKELVDGAQIEYSTESSQLIQAIHQLFDAQLRELARHAVPDHSHERQKLGIFGH